MRFVWRIVKATNSDAETLAAFQANKGTSLITVCLGSWRWEIHPLSLIPSKVEVSPHHHLLELLKNMVAMVGIFALKNKWKFELLNLPPNLLGQLCP